MRRELRYAPRALADLDALSAWLTQPGSGVAARRRLTAIWNAIEQLAHRPYLYPVGQNRGVRELQCAGGYRVLFELVPDTGRDETEGDVRVLRVFGPGQDRTPKA